MRVLARLAAGILLAVSASIVAPGSAAAGVTCSQYGCDGKDPIATGCAADAVTVASAPVMSSQSPYGARYGTINLRWSAKCQTNWAQLVLMNPNNPGKWFRTVWIERWFRTAARTRNEFTFSGSGSPIWGDMLWAPQCAKAGAYMQISGDVQPKQADGTTAEAC
jgi:hypothetical protein